MSKKYIVKERRFVTKERLTASSLMSFNKEVLEAYSKVNVFRFDKRRERRRMRKAFKSKTPFTFKF